MFKLIKEWWADPVFPQREEVAEKDLINWVKQVLVTDSRPLNADYLALRLIKNLNKRIEKLEANSKES